MEVFVARQPIFTSKKKIFGYELLFRLGLENSFPDIDGDIATSNLISNLFFPFEFNEILGCKPGLINFTQKLILQNLPLLLPKEKFIIEVLEDVEPEEDVISALELIKDKGYMIALDDFVYHNKFDPMIKLSRIIKFDLRATPLSSLLNIIQEIKSKYKVTLLAEKVETYEEFKKAKKLGFTLFQGYFFSRPEILSTKGVSTNQIIKLKLINEIGQKDLNYEKIEAFIKNDAPVAFKLMKYTNSAYFNRRIPIDTIKDAIAYIGGDELRKFIKVAVMSDLGAKKPNELIRISIIRARMCERCVKIFKTKFSGDELFTLGLFSLMDALLDCKMEDILGHIALSDKMKIALLGNDKKFNRILDIIIGFERGNWENSIFKAMSGSALETKLPNLYFDSVKMAEAFYY
jgi:EAL and modified HD-GYP domain-containing signal transduction protein